MLTQRVRKSGNSLIVTIPHEEAERLEIHEGDLIAFDPRKVETIQRYVMPHDVQAAADAIWAEPEFQAAMEYLKDR
jgi:antitoxin component of MazEF toxin-antitoxin module